MQRYFLELAYKGTNFHGWQIQNNAITVQEELDKALSTLLREKILTTGAGRTDTGVHANFFVAHFDSQHSDISDDEKFIYKINRLLNKDVVIYKIYKVAHHAHARFDATARTYKYYISRQKDPFYRDFCFEYVGRLDIELMNKAANLLFEYDDFKSFCKLHSDVKTTLCKIYKSVWTIEGNSYVYHVKADRFLRNMVRALVGTMFEVGRNRMSLIEFKELINKKDRNLAGASVLAKGLFLVDIEYSEKIFLNP